MTDNEIIKALECCVNADCENCPSKTICDSDTERFVVDIFALINRQKETIEQLKTALFKCGEEAVKMQETINRQKDELEQQDKEIESLKGILDDCGSVYERWLTNERGLKAARAEAVKEFAEMLKKEVDGWYYDFASMDDAMDALTDIDNLVKEFTGGADGNQSL